MCSEIGNGSEKLKMLLLTTEVLDDFGEISQCRLITFPKMVSVSLNLK